MAEYLANTYAEGQASPASLALSHDSLLPVRVGTRMFESTTSIGLRPTQEDRMTVVTKFFREEVSFCGVFDGTVGDDAAEYISKNIITHLCSALGVGNADGGLLMRRPQGLGQTNVSDEEAEALKDALRNTFLSADRALIEHCAARKLHYASCTGVTCFLWKNLLTVAHVGDSKACIAKVTGEGEVHPEWLTVDHKPNMPHELKRIEANGGSLAWLHGNKPYIRGGDFFRRQAAGEHPKQLNYSRAFGGKDLKMYGLSAEPDVSHFEIMAEDRLVLIASDGLWDVLNPKTACEVALWARREGKSATQEVVRHAIEKMPVVGVRDNISVIAIFLNEQPSSS